MAKIARKNQKVFANGATNNGQFGSAQLGTKVEDQDLDVLQALSAFDTGWNDATISGQRLPTLEEMQALHYITTSQIAYLFQEGLAEYNSATNYFTDSIVKKSGTYELYGSLINDNLGNALPSAVDDANWKYLGDLSSLSDGGAGTLIDIQVFTSSGTWTKPAGTASVDVIVTGGGGGGGGSATTQNNCTGGFGAGGGTAFELISAGIGATETITVGAAGTAGTATGNGGDGGTSSFGSHCSAFGGDGGDGGAVNTSAQGGSTSGGDARSTNGGNGSGTSPSDVNAGYFNGLGGSSYWGGGGSSRHGGAGYAGVAHGSGGGAGSRNAGSAQVGASGAGGIVIVASYT